MKEYIFTVKGMACEMCENHINDAVRRTADVKSVKSNRNRNETVVVAEGLNTALVSETIRNLGYDVDGISEKPYQKRSLFGFRK
ncbi:MAG: heavy-metal-associated domain-containing protein [Clostridia bacterium]|nr:heavy-metal-associated domain-containing protein [Clostridia bacterium]